MAIFMNIRCKNEEEHYFHDHAIIREKICLGTTSCGEVLHSPHKYDAEEKVWCPGICNCGLISYLHGPGEHK